MVFQSPTTLENTIRTIFPEMWLRELAIKTCFIKRERKIKPEVIFWVLTLGFCVYNQCTIAGLKRLYEIEANISISDSSWYYRFTPELICIRLRKKTSKSVIFYAKIITLELENRHT
jgi:putative transposase